MLKSELNISKLLSRIFSSGRELNAEKRRIFRNRNSLAEKYGLSRFYFRTFIRRTIYARSRARARSPTIIRRPPPNRRRKTRDITAFGTKLDTRQLRREILFGITRLSLALVSSRFRQSYYFSHRRSSAGTEQRTRMSEGLYAPNNDAERGPSRLFSVTSTHALQKLLEQINKRPNKQTNQSSAPTITRHTTSCYDVSITSARHKRAIMHLACTYRHRSSTQRREVNTAASPRKIIERSRSRHSRLCVCMSQVAHSVTKTTSGSNPKGKSDFSHRKTRVASGTRSRFR